MRKICVVVASRANYGRIKSVLEAIESNNELELQLIVAASTLLERFGKAVNVINKDGFTPCRTIHYVVEGETPETQAKSTGLGILELATAFAELKPDCVITVADRFETMATAIAATYLNIPLVHVQGGEVSGNIDDRVRHAITKLADIHFVCSEESRNRVIRLGENPELVFNYGCPAMDLLANGDLPISNSIMSKYGGTGAPIDWEKPYLLLVQHPVTTSYGEGFSQIAATLNAVKSFSSIQKIVLWPNVDAGSDDVSKGIRVFRENNSSENFHYFKNFSPEDYARVLNNAVCCVGNSSSFIREGSYLGTPAILIGDRQTGRETGNNCKLVESYDTQLIENAIKEQLVKGKLPQDCRFGKGNAGKLIAAELTRVALDTPKKGLV